MFSVDLLDYCFSDGDLGKSFGILSQVEYHSQYISSSQFSVEKHVAAGIETPSLPLNMCSLALFGPLLENLPVWLQRKYFAKKNQSI